MNGIVPAFRDPSVEEFDTRTLLKNAARQAAQRHFEDFLIVDVDAHHYETESMPEIIKYIEDPVLRATATAKSGVYAGAPTLMNNQTGFQDMGGRIGRYSTRSSEKTPEGNGHRDSHLTKRVVW